MRWVGICAAWFLSALVALWACGGGAAAAPKPPKKGGSIKCEASAGQDDDAKSAGKAAKAAHKSAKTKKKDDDDDDDSDDDDDDNEGVRFALGSGCAKLTGSVSYTFQQAKKSGARVPVFVNRNGTLSAGSSVNTLNADIGLETAHQTGLGEFRTSFSGNWSKSTGDGTQNGTASVSGWSVGLSDLTVGYTGSLMSFWEGDFISTAIAPGRSANTVVYEHEFADHNKVALGVELSLPTTRQTQTGFTSFDFSEPVYTARWLRETDPWTLHVSGLVRQADFSNSPLLSFLPKTDTVQTGWAASLGSKVSLPFIKDGDEASVQATYAVDASPYLGINTDLTTFQNVVHVTGPTTGWSAVASYHHEWSDQFESNIYGSYVSLTADLLLAKPAAQSFRSGLNLYWSPVDHLKFGVELGYVDMKLDPNGMLGFFDGASGHAWTAYLQVSAEL